MARTTARTELFGTWLQGGMVVSDMGFSTGSRFFVDSGATAAADDTGHGRSPDAPFATLDYAIGRCAANNGDIIYVMPGHGEIYVATNGWDLDVQGVKVLGLGWGGSKPTFTFNDTDAQVNIGASCCWIENLRFITSISAVVAAVQVEGVVDTTFKNCEWYWGDTTGDDFVISLELEAGAHRTTIENCRFLAEPAVAGAAAAINLTGACNNVIIRNCEFMGDYSTACVNVAVASLGLMFIDNLVYNADAGEPYLEVAATTTGIIANTRGLASGATIAANAVANAMAHCENFVCNTAGTAAILVGAGGVPVVDAD